MLEHLLPYSYAALIPLAILEGPILSIVCGVGAALGYLNPLVVMPILLGGDLLPDLVYWLCGRWGTRLAWVRRFATRVKLLREHLPAIEELWRTRLYSTMLSAKLAWGISAPFIVSAGMARVPLGRFLFASLLVSVPYLGILMGAGYALTLAYGSLGLSPSAARALVGGVGLVFLAVLIFVVRRARRELNPRLARVRSNIVLPDSAL